MRLYRFPYSTNVERVALALGHKVLEVESVQVDFEDRSVVREISGQDLVPVLEDEEQVVADSTAILRYLEQHYPTPPLYPQSPSRRAEMHIFIDWFNRVWKRPPNQMEAEMGRPNPDQEKIGNLGQVMTFYLDLFEAMLEGRPYLMGDELSAADCIAWPFLKYALIPPPDDDPHLFHKILMDHQPLGDSRAGLAAWIRTMDEHPRV